MSDPEELGVAEAKARFSELIDRVGRGERFVVLRRGAPVLALVAPEHATAGSPKPLGLAALTGALAEWDDLPRVVQEIYKARESSCGRPAPHRDW